MKRSEQGMSLIEVLIGAAILALLVSLLSDKLKWGKEEVTNLTNRLKARHLLDRAIADIVANTALYPPQQMGSQPMTYIGCFNREGVLVKNNKGTENYWLENLPVVDCKSSKPVSSKRCSLDASFGNAYFEMQIRPSNDGQKKADVNILAYDFRAQSFVSMYCSSVHTESSF